MALAQAAALQRPVAARDFAALRVVRHPPPRVVILAIPTGEMRFAAVGFGTDLGGHFPSETRGEWEGESPYLADGFSGIDS